ncbi:hypothetical protein [Rhizobium sp. BK251]|uniref:hypothetical protein n=1 Tax=Rhizobium sp. BK251 TaxID=2512125 RepID=UPI00104B6EA4|nr:hypothetical protein [Rhizobium sp. BK251]TCL64114.1 hypothetical protein EV286_11549 [Rhizobium sp. BK251]
MSFDKRLAGKGVRFVPKPRRYFEAIGEGPVATCRSAKPLRGMTSELAPDEHLGLERRVRQTLILFLQKGDR